MEKTLNFKIINVNSFIDKELVNLKEEVTENSTTMGNTLNITILPDDVDFGTLSAGDVVTVTIS